MPEPVITENQDKKEEPKKSVIQEVREKTFTQLLREQQEARNAAKDTPVETPADEPIPSEADKKKKDEEEQAARAQEEAKRQADAAAEEEKRREEVAKKAAEEVIAKQKAEEEAKAQVARREQEQKEREERLKPKFTGKDENGNASPKDYEELAAESARIAEEKAYARLKEEEAAARKAQEEKQQLEAQATAKQQEAQKAYEAALQKQLDEDLNDIYTAGDLPKITNKEDEKDPGNIAFRQLFETAQRINADRIKSGKSPIASIKLIRYGKDEKGEPYFKLPSPPPGHDAPVIGTESPVGKELPEDRYIPSRDRKKSWTQVIKEETARQKRKLNIRGM